MLPCKEITLFENSALLISVLLYQFVKQIVLIKVNEIIVGLPLSNLFNCIKYLFIYTVSCEVYLHLRAFFFFFWSSHFDHTEESGRIATTSWPRRR